MLPLSCDFALLRIPPKQDPNKSRVRRNVDQKCVSTEVISMFSTRFPRKPHYIFKASARNRKITTQKIYNTAKIPNIPRNIWGKFSRHWQYWSNFHVLPTATLFSVLQMFSVRNSSKYVKVCHELFL